MPPEEQASRDRLLVEAERLFMAFGFAAVSTRAICVAAGVTQPSLYHHFGSKEELYLAVVQRWLADLGAGIQQAITTGTTLRDQLHGIAVLLWSDAAGEYQAMQRDALLHMPPDHRRQVAQTISVMLIAPVAGLMRAAQARGELPTGIDPLVLTQLFWGVVDGVSGIYHRGDNTLPAPAANGAIIDFFLAGTRGTDPAAFGGWRIPS